MKKTALLILICLIWLSVVSGLAEELYQVQYQVQYHYDMAQQLLSIVNAHRAAGDGWYWNADNKTKTFVFGLEPLEYSEDLEKVAMQRAAEIAILFDHVRPNGSQWHTIYPGVKVAENIAAGQTSAQEAFVSWWEEDKPYSGQGHRRAILNGEYTKVGIGCVSVGDVYFWSMSFSSGGNFDSIKNNPNTLTVEVTAEVLKSARSWSVSPTKINMKAGETVSLPSQATAVSGPYNITRFTVMNPAWKSSGNLVSISGGQMTALAEGDMKLYLFTGGGPEISVSIRGGVAPKPTAAPTSTPAPTPAPADPKYTATAKFNAEELLLTGAVKHVEGTAEAQTLFARITYFMEGGNYTVVSTPVDEDGSFESMFSGTIVHISLQVTNSSRIRPGTYTRYGGCEFDVK